MSATHLPRALQTVAAVMPGPQLCLDDSYTRHCTAKVTACEPAAASGKKGAAKSKRWAVQLSQTVLYAEGVHFAL